jgi:hypothetical protein
MHTRPENMGESLSKAPLSTSASLFARLGPVPQSEEVSSSDRGLGMQHAVSYFR